MAATSAAPSRRERIREISAGEGNRAGSGLSFGQIAAEARCPTHSSSRAGLPPPPRRVYSRVRLARGPDHRPRRRARYHAGGPFLDWARSIYGRRLPAAAHGLLARCQRRRLGTRPGAAPPSDSSSRSASRRSGGPALAALPLARGSGAGLSVVPVGRAAAGDGAAGDAVGARRRGASAAESDCRPDLARLLLVFLLFKLMFLSGATKLLSGDPTWRTLTALDYHFETQPLPPWTAWYAHQLPVAMRRALTVCDARGRARGTLAPPPPRAASARSASALWRRSPCSRSASRRPATTASSTAHDGAVRAAARRRALARLRLRRSDGELQPETAPRRTLVRLVASRCCSVSACSACVREIAYTVPEGRGLR